MSYALGQQTLHGLPCVRVAPAATRINIGRTTNPKALTVRHYEKSFVYRPKSCLWYSLSFPAGSAR